MKLLAEPKAIDVAQIKSILDAHDSARMRTWLGICSRCGLCAESCLFYLGNKGNPKMSPSYKIMATLGEMYKRKGNLDLEFLLGAAEILWGECTTCKRCSMYCPFGIDMAAMFSIGRSVCFSQGIVPEGIAKTLPLYRDSGNQMGVSQEEYLDACSWMEEDTAEEIAGLTIPIDKTDVNFMYTMNPREPLYHPKEMGQIAQIFTIVGESWTMASTDWDCTNLAMFAGDRPFAGEIVRKMYDKALSLRAKNILITECGHAFRSAGYEGPYLAGYESGLPPLPVIHSVDLFARYLREGRIKIDPGKMITEAVTYQDPCNISRNGGLSKQAREIIKQTCTDFREMQPNGAHNHCCGGGGGYMPMGLEYKEKRMRSGWVKAEQIRATGAKIVITPCHNCFDQIRDLNAEYNLGIRQLTFKEILCESMVIPEEFVVKDK